MSNKLSRLKSKESAQQYISSYLSENHCADCGESDPTVLTFDHVMGKKKGNVSDLVRGGYSLGTIKSEIDKTEVVCFNCHMRRERKRGR